MNEQMFLPLPSRLVDVVVERVDRLDLVRPADRQQVRLAHPEGVERGGRGDDLVLRELRQRGERRRGAEHLRERHDVALDLVVLLDGGRRRVLRVLLDQLDLVLAGDAALRVDVVEVDLVAGRQRLADHRHRAGQRRQHAELDRLAVEARGRSRATASPDVAGVTLVVGGAPAARRAPAPAARRSRTASSCLSSSVGERPCLEVRLHTEPHGGQPAWLEHQEQDDQQPEDGLLRDSTEMKPSSPACRTPGIESE